jgi:cardiolipin synthase
MHGMLHEILAALVSDDAVRWALIVADVLALATVPSVLRRRRGRPAALGWVLALVALPYLGVLAWWMLGRTHLQRLVGRRRHATRRTFAPAPEPVEGAPEDPMAPLPAVLPFASAEARWTDGAFPPVRGNTVELLVDGREAFPAFHAAIEQARESVHVVFYIWRADETGVRLRDALVRAARRGVTVRLLIDSVGSILTRPRFFRPLVEAGGEVVRFLPVGWPPWRPTFNFRNHRKAMIVDRRLAFTGGMNVGREYEREWHDFAVALRGPIVADIDAVFREDWAFAAGGTLAAAPATGGALPGDVTAAALATGPDRENDRAHEALFLAFTAARKRILLTTPYFLPGTSLIDALRAAVSRGVTVLVMVPRRGDNRLARLATRACLHLAGDAGVRVLLHEDMVHAKALVVDDRLSAIGSANVDSRSFRLSFELTCFFDSPELADRLAGVFEAHSRRCTPWTRPPRSKMGEVIESAAHLLSPLL